MSKTVKIPEPEYEAARERAESDDVTIGAVIREWHQKATMWDERADE